MSDEMSAKLQRLVEINRMQEALKAEKDALDVYFQQLAEDDLKNSKKKSVAYAAEGMRVTVTLAKKVGLIYANLIARVFRDLKDDVIKTDTKFTLSATGQRILGGIASGEYVRQTVEEVLVQIAQPDKLPLLRKKVRGKNYEGDIKSLMVITGCSYEQAAEDAYLVQEAAVWQELQSVLVVNGIPQERWTEMIENIKAGVMVEETPKVRLEMA